jgi:cystathionine beta-lyase/cystathionine gamma-synthase
MTRQSKNAQRIVEALANHPAISKVNYPTHFTDPEQIRIRDKQCDFPGGIFSIELHGGKTAAFDFLRNLSIAKDAVSLGGVETLACHPATTTHSEMTKDELDRYGISEGLVRVSVGIEDRRDLIREFHAALDAISPEHGENPAKKSRP